MDTFADRMARQWAEIERALKLANRNPAFRPQVESLINIYFDLIDEMAAELERRRVTGTAGLEN
jgi:predicted nucleotidyltransferase